MLISLEGEHNVSNDEQWPCREQCYTLLHAWTAYCIETACCQLAGSVLGRHGSCGVSLCGLFNRGSRASISRHQDRGERHRWHQRSGRRVRRRQVDQNICTFYLSSFDTSMHVVLRQCRLNCMKAILPARRLNWRTEAVSVRPQPPVLVFWRLQVYY